jgi:hypothetical protein
VRIAGTEGTRSAASCPANNSTARSCCGSIRVTPGPERDVRRNLGTADDDYDQLVRAASATAGHAATVRMCSRHTAIEQVPIPIRSVDTQP